MLMWAKVASLSGKASAGEFSPPFTVNTGETIILHVFRILMFHHRLPKEVVKIFSTNICQIENVL